LTLGRYTILVLGVVAASVAIAAPLLLRRLDAPARAAVAYGAALAVLNTLAAHALVVWSDRRSTQAFLRAVLGGMLGRLALMLAAVVAGVLALGLPKVPLALALLSYFVVFLVMELSILHRRTGAPAGPAR
jgi:putative flippase GtrA